MSESNPRPDASDGVPQEFYDHDDGDQVCFVCKNPRFELLYRVTHYGFPFEFKKCHCGLIKQTPMPNEDFFEWFFNSDLFFSAKASKKREIWGFYDYFKDEPSRLATSERRYRVLSRYFESDGPLDVMKIGPSTGTFLHVAKGHGHNALGCDVSSQFVAHARDNYDVQIDHGRFEKLNYEAESFDRVLLFNVLENVPNQAEFLEAVHASIRPGGRFILNFVDEHRNMLSALQKERYFLYRPPICYVYTQQVLTRVLSDFGFEVETVTRDVRYMHLEKILTLLGWHSVSKLANKLGIAHRPFPIYAYPSRIVVARKVS